jgi:Lon protease-like protein
MSPDEDFSFAEKEFSGIARLFPLPNLVLFPRVMQPLHIFEPRYCDLLEAAVAGDRLIAMATLAPGWEMDYEGRPAVFPVACLSRVSVYRRLAEGGYNVLMVGLRRIRLVRELPPTRSYREAEAQLCEDRCPSQEAGARAQAQRWLRRAFLRILPGLPQAHDQLEQLLGSDISLGVLADIISYVMDIDLREKEALLAETNVLRRARRVLEHLAAPVAAHQIEPPQAATFPPGFSQN